MPTIAPTPYKSIPDTRPDFFKTIMEGRTEYYHRTYSLSERWKKITSAIEAITSSNGEKLFEAKTWRRIFKKGIWGSCDKIRFVADPRMKIHEVPLSPLKEHIPRDAPFNYIKGQKDPRPLFRKIQDHLDCITYNEFLDGLSSCIRELERRLQGEPYQIGFEPRGSNAWAFEIALKYLNRKNVAAYRIGAALPLADKSPNLVIFHDASYDEDKIDQLIKTTRFQAKDSKFKNFKIFVVVPFVNRKTIKAALSNHSTRNPNEHFEVHLITTQRAIRSIRECLSNSEIDKIAATGAETHLSKKSITWLDWSVSQYDELPDFLVKGPSPYLTTHNLDSYKHAS